MDGCGTMKRHRDRPTSVPASLDEEGRWPSLQVGDGPTRPETWRGQRLLSGMQCDCTPRATGCLVALEVSLAARTIRLAAEPGPPCHAMAGRTHPSAGVLPGGVHVRALNVYNPQKRCRSTEALCTAPASIGE